MTDILKLKVNNEWVAIPALKGDTGATGNGILKIEKTSTSGLVDTYTITYTNGNTFNFTVTNGEDGTGAVTSVNGETGVVVLDASDVGALPDNTVIPTDTSDLTNGAGFITSSALSGYATETWVGNQGYITGITSTDVTNALGFTPYDSSNPNGYTTNTGTVTSVNNVSPTNGNVTLSIPSEVTENTVSGWGFTKNVGTVTSVNNTSPVNGNVTLTIPDALPSQTGNSGKFLSTDGTDASWESVPTRNIGEIIQSTIPLTDAGLHLLDGSLLAYGSYQAFIDYIADLYDSGDYTAIFDTEANWQIAVTTYGVCAKFVYDSVNNTVRLPKYGTQILTKSSSLTTVSTVPVKGNGMTLGLTDGTYQAGPGQSNGADFYRNVYGQPVGTSYSAGYLTTGKSVGVTTDGTKSGIVADTSSVASLKNYPLDGYYYIVMATSTKTDIQVDIDEIATDLNGKADTDLTNVNNSGTSRGASWAMPSGTYEDLTLGASGSTYTAPANGWVVSKLVTSSQGNCWSRISSTTKISCTSSFNNVGWQIDCILPVSKGEQFKYEYNIQATLVYNNLYFIYAVGSESEA